jgi:hypothetical protein
MSYILHVDGRAEEVTPTNGKSFSVEELQKHVGGYAENIPLVGRTPNVFNVLANEDGQRKNLPLNPIASNLCKRVIVGPVLVITVKGHMS